MTSSTRSAARAAESSPALRIAARAGYAANGVVHILIGGIVLAIARGGEGESDQTGAFKAIAQAPLGIVLLWVLAVALAALGVWHLLAGFIATESTPDAKGAAKKWGRRVSEWGQGVVFLALAFVAASVALGARPDADSSAEDASRGVLSIPGGPWVLGAVGVGIAIGGIAFVWMGIARSFRKKVRIPSGAAGAALTTLGVVGFVAKGVALAIVGILLVVAAIRVDPEAAGGLDGAIQALLGAPYGPVLVTMVGGGLIAYGVFTIFRARFAKL